MIKHSVSTPTHIAIIVDGNRRWAQKQGLPIIAGHKFATDKTIEKIVFHCLQKQIKYVTFWAFSTEIWKRGEKFVSSLFQLLAQTLQKNVDKYHQAGIRLNTIGNLSKLPPPLANKIEQLKKKSSSNQNLTVTLALNYGGRDEIIRAVKKLIKDKNFNPENIDGLTETDFSQYLDTYDLPDPDIIIRTGGEKRLSGFLSWQSQYSEFFFTDTLMPDFTIEEFDQILTEFGKRQRRFGK
jgi:undecaprenyl diphosphate synthase